MKPCNFIKTLEVKYRLSNLNGFLEKIDHNSSSLTRLSFYVSMLIAPSAVPSQWQSTKLGLSLEQPQMGLKEGNRISRRLKILPFQFILDCNNQLCNSNYAQQSSKRHPAGMRMPPHPNVKIQRSSFKVESPF